LQRITWQWSLNERTSKSGAVRADGERIISKIQNLPSTIGRCNR
jgi:hypothetical protein